MVYNELRPLSLAALLGAMLMLGPAALAGASVSKSDKTAANNGPYAVLHHISLDSSTKITALAADPSGAQVYAAVGHDVHAFDAESGQLDAARSLPGNITGLATAADGAHTLYATIGSPKQLVILRGKSLEIIGTIQLPDASPSSVLYDAGQSAVFVESVRDHTIFRIDPAQRKIVGSLKLPGTLSQMAANDRGRLYVANSSDNALDVVDTASMRFVGSIPLAGCKAPSGLAMDPVGRRLFVACENGTALIVDADMGFVFVRLPIASGPSLKAAFAFHPFGPDGWKGGAFFAGAKGALDAIRMNAFVRYAGVARMRLGGTGTALALDPAAHQIWLALSPRAPQGAQLLVLGTQ